jgi:hypothetical protein
LRYTTIDYARGKVSDDSDIIFKTGSKPTFGRIRRIFKVNKGEPLFYVETISNLSDFEFIDSSNRYKFSTIQTGSFADGANNVFITAQGIVEKCVFYQRYVHFLITVANEL